ncbi:MAG: M28 family peptidase [Chloroflexota bacterium]
MASGSASLRSGFAVAILLPVVVIAFAVACSGDDSSSSTPSASPTPTASTTPTASPVVTPTPGFSTSQDFDAAEADAMLKHLAVDIGIRAGGTDGEQQAADYLRDLLASWGYEASEQPFPIDVYKASSTVLSETAPTAKDLAPLALLNAKPGAVDGEIVVVPGLGEAGDFPPSTSGRIALVERGTITFTEKIAAAEAAGAIGVIVYNNQPGNVQAPLRVPSNVPAVTISQEEGQALVTQAQAGTVNVHLAIEATISEGQSHNVLAKAPGSDCRVLVGGHYDSVPAGPGANDNGSGTVVAMEMARTLATRGETAHVCFTLFGSEELGLVGSAYYVSQLTPDERGAIVGMLNFDMLGMGTDWAFIGTDALTQLALQVATENGIVSRIEAGVPIGVGSDHASFTQLEIPAILFNCFCDPNYHLATDRFENVLPQRLLEAGEIGLGMVEALRPAS